MSRYRQARFALLTQHGKEAVVAPALARAFDATLEVVRSIDTDSFGTFTREVPRCGTQLEAARRKARLAIGSGACALGLGSEGAFGAGELGWGSTNHEVLMLLDDVLGLEVVGRASAPGVHVQGLVSGWTQLEDTARAALFPSHGLTLRPDGAADPRLTKGLASWESLRRAFGESQLASAGGQVFVESELRAHLNPTRMQTIAAAAEDLVRRLASSCTECGAPGFGAERALRGLPCEACGAPTNAIARVEWACVGCDFRQPRPVAERVASAQWCPRCNP